MAAIDTHRAIEKIMATGVSKETAEAIVDTVSSKNDLKLEISELKSELKSEMNIIIHNIKWQSAMGLLIKDLFLST